MYVERDHFWHFLAANFGRKRSHHVMDASCRFKSFLGAVSFCRRAALTNLPGLPIRNSEVGSSENDLQPKDSPVFLLGRQKFWSHNTIVL